MLWVLFKIFKRPENYDCLHATAIDIIVERSMIVNQHISVHRFFDLAILYGDTTRHYVMCRAVVADPFVFREWM